MFQFFRKLFDTDFMPHGFCFFWNPEIVWLHVISDGLTALSYFVIPLALVYLVRKRRDLAFHWMFILFGIFILACGTTHAMSIVTLWHPVYRLDGLIKAITALASVPTAFLLIRLVPQVVTLPSPGQLREANRALEHEVRERIAAEERVRTANAELERRVDERTLQLHQANQQLVTLNEDLKHFAYAATHDLQEPLRIVSAFNQLLARDFGGTLPKKALEYMAFSTDAAHRMQNLLTGLQEYWHESDGAEERPDFVRVEDVLRKALANLNMAIEESGAVVTYGELPAVIADETMLLQLFQNLISNSIKYSGEGTPRIHISAQKVDGQKAGPQEASEEWLFSISDNGVGIAPEFRERVFQVFKRLHGREYPGIGMGLALCRKIVERRGGRIWVDDTETGLGTAIKFTVREEAFADEAA